jgi:prepilin-type N-terminal cleavage/methylation domain-containing protein
MMKVARRSPGASTVRSRSGFTLIELLVALSVGAIVLLSARGVLEAIGDQSARITLAAHHADRVANAERALRALVMRMEMGVSPGVQFMGSSDTARFSTWCEVPSGWLERCTAVLKVVNVRGERQLVMELSTGQAHVVRSSFADGEIRYLASGAGGGVWIRDWGAGEVAPVAVVILAGADTTVLRTGIGE